MKSYPIILILFLSLLTFSCTDTLADLGKGIQPSSDAIEIGADTVHLASSDIFIESVEMSVNPDSFLLGTYINTKYGSTRADILAQLKSPVEFTLPKGAVADSAKVFMSYYSYFGDAYSPIEVSIHQMDKGWFDYSKAYPTNLDPADYTDVADTALLMGKKVFTARNASKPTTTITEVSIPLKDYFAKHRFFPDTTTANYYSDTNFRKLFKGMYITTNYGSATMLNISQIDLLYYYHYSYTYKKANGIDTTRIVNNVLTFPANDEVRQINRFTHSDRKAVVQLDEKYNFIASPANMQANVTIPLKRIQEKLNAKINGKKQVINNAVIEVEAVVDEADDTLAMPAVKYLLLVKESAISPTDRFFEKKELPSDTCAIVGTYSRSEIGTSGTYKYFYSFNVAGLIANELKNNQAAIKAQDLTKDIEMLKLRLIPVKVTYNSSGYITAVTHQNIMSGVKIKSGKNESPMTLKMVYSGF